MQRIRNIKTSKTEKQEKDFLVSLKAKKRFHLQSTDWTQLNDVSIFNKKEMIAWRRQLRNFPIFEDSDETTERALEKLIDQKPIIEIVDIPTDEYVSNDQSDERIKELEQEINRVKEALNDEIIYLPHEDAKQKLEECFNEYRSNELIQKGNIVEYNLKKIMLEEAVEKDLSNGNSSTPLLDQDTTDHSSSELHKIINDCKSYFKNINNLYTRLNKEQRSLYNMDSNEMNEWFESHGYRYRCKD